jgi:hypothetical protein
MLKQVQHDEELENVILNLFQDLRVGLLRERKKIAFTKALPAPDTSKSIAQIAHKRNPRTRVRRNDEAMKNKCWYQKIEKEVVGATTSC